MQRPYNGDRPDVLNQLDIPETEKEYKSKEKYVRENIAEKLRFLRSGIRLAKHVLALFRYMKDGNIPWYRKSVVVGALAYFIMPVDAIPDVLPLIGYLDDFGVIAAVLGYLGSEIRPYYFSSPGMGNLDEDRLSEESAA
jgi:uncharacterized membrane protein YkvA (DUF1232 family)